MALPRLLRVPPLPRRRAFPPCLLFICRRLRYPDRERYAVGFAERDAEWLSVRIADCLCFSGDCSSERGVIARVFALPGE